MPYQTIYNEESGGIKTLTDFTSGEDEFLTRRNVLVNLTGSQTLLSSRRYYFQHQIKVIDNSYFSWELSNHLLYEDKNRQFEESKTEEEYHKSEVLNPTKTDDQFALKNLETSLGNSFALGKFGKAQINLTYHRLEYGNRNDSIFLEKDTARFWKLVRPLNMSIHLSLLLQKDISLSVYMEKKYP